jgi:hypothetical protein
MMHPQLLEGLKEESQVKDSGKREGVGARSLTRNTRRVEGRVGAPGSGLGRVTSLIHLLEPGSNPHKVIKIHFAHFWCCDKPRATLDSLDSLRLGLGGSHHLPPYNILCASSPHLHPNGIFSWDSQSGVPKLSRFGLLRLWAFITSCSDLRLG